HLALVNYFSGNLDHFVDDYYVGVKSNFVLFYGHKCVATAQLYAMEESLQGIQGYEFPNGGRLGVEMSKILKAHYYIENSSNRHFVFTSTIFLYLNISCNLFCLYLFEEHAGSHLLMLTSIDTEKSTVLGVNLFIHTPARKLELSKILHTYPELLDRLEKALYISVNAMG
ncbi:hypothetical protein ACJX0J_032738, partial [Zea mays]